ncbi:MAG: lysylphosphatidylglycerol synthase transmembrane domain-containing protein [Bacteroidota bacterium]
MPHPQSRALARIWTPALNLWSRPWFQQGLRWVLTLTALVYIGWSLYHQHVWEQSIWQVWEAASFLPFILGVSMLPINLWLEVKKWCLLVRQAKPSYSMNSAWRGVLAGAAAGIFTPNRMGDYAGRLMYLPAGFHVKAAVYTFVSRIAQMAVTLLLGTLALWSLYLDGRWLGWTAGWLGTLLSLSSMISLGATLAFRYPAQVLYVVERIPIRGKILGQIKQALLCLSPSLIRRVWCLSLFRGIVFVGQYSLMMMAFLEASTWPLVVASVCLVFLLKSVVPAMALAELGLRESVALMVMGAFGWASAHIVFGTFGLYVINLVLPALLGLGWMLRSRQTKEIPAIRPDAPHQIEASIK